MRAVMVVGLGSMGKRRIRLLQQISSRFRICGVDQQEGRRREVAQLYGIMCYSSISEAFSAQAPDVGFVCTSPLAHSSIIRELLMLKMHVFTEINLVSDGYEENMKLAAEQDRVLFLSSTFLYRNDIQYMIQQCSGKKMDYIIHSGQYLPDWHPWESYKNFFVGQVRTNGCREILAIDLPWIIAAFGKVTDIHTRKSKNSSLDLDYEDNYIISFEHENGSKGVFVCDLLSRKAGRSAEIFSEDIYLEWRGTPDSLMQYNDSTGKPMFVETYTKPLDHRAEYASNIIENAYKEEIETFFGVIEGRISARYTFADDLYTIDIINRIEGRT